MMERNGPGGINTERRSPIIVSGVATPKSHAKSNIAVVIVMPATRPASNPARSAFVLVIGCRILQFGSHDEIKLFLIRRSPRRAPLQLFECDPQQCRNDSGTCDKCAAQRSGNFRLSAGPATMIHGNFENAQTRSGGTH